MYQTLARIWFGIFGILAAVGVVMSAFLSAATQPQKLADSGGLADPSHFEHVVVRFTNTFFYFTIFSNIVVAVTCILLAISLQRSSTVFKVFRLFGLVGIIVTGIVYNAVLAALSHPEGWNAVSNAILHIIVPIASTLGWLIFGPRLEFRWAYIGWALIVGLAWVAVTLIRGAIIHWYPYPFLNVDKLGLGTVLINCVGILIAAFIFALIILGLDKLLPGPKFPLSTQPQDSADR